MIPIETEGLTFWANNKSYYVRLDKMIDDTQFVFQAFTPEIGCMIFKYDFDSGRYLCTENYKDQKALITEIEDYINELN